MKDSSYFNSINSLNGMALPAKKTACARESNKSDISFSDMFEEASKSAGKSVSKERTQEKRNESREEAHAKNTSAKQDSETMESLKEAMLSPLLKYIYSVVYKNPDILSNSERSALGLDKQKSGQVGLKELQKFLADRGIKFTDLDSDKLRNLVQRNDRGTVVAYLDDLIRERLYSGAKDSSGRVKEKSGAGLFGDVKTPKDLKNKEVIDRIISHIKLQNLAKSTEVVIRLNPEYLGELKIKINVEGKKTNVEFTAKNEETKAIINDGIIDLKKALSAKGLDIEEIKVG